MDGEYTSEEIDLLDSIMNSEGLNAFDPTYKMTNFNPVLRHPLPLSDHRYLYEKNLRTILSCKPEFQGMAAISRGDAWTLEEVYMRHGPIVLTPKNGISPLHLSVQLNIYECVLVLINIGVDVNEVNSLGYTPLFVATKSGFDSIVELLTKNNAKIYNSKADENPETTNLEVYPERQSEIPAEKVPMNSYLYSKSSHYY